MTVFNLKPTHKAVKDYYNEISNLSTFGVSHEGAVSPAFANLLRHCGAQFKLSLIEQHSMKRVGYPSSSHPIKVDGLMVNEWKYPRGIWEAKDSNDVLEKEVKNKFDDGYPKENILFQAPDHIIIWQDGNEIFNKHITKPEHLIEGLKIFFEYQPPAFEEWQQAVEEFKLIVRQLAEGLLELIEKERVTNKTFIQALDEFTLLCRETINPNISTEAIEEMLIQHMLTERIFRKVFNNPDFAERNIIAHEIEKVISALTSHSFSRHDFLKSLDRFYSAIETAAASIQDFSQKQSFLNTVYEKFFQGFSVKDADTHGIVYTPQPIVRFMVNSIEYILRKEFGRSLSDEGVHIIDPFVGTGNFIVWIIRDMLRSKLPYKYAHEIHCNEVLLLPYYIASMNIEHEYYELTDKYEPFEGICLVDTFDIVEGKQLSYLTKENTVRVKRQQNADIFVVIGNPPYNAGQVNENDNNKNRKYEVIDKRVSQTYGKDSKATLLRKLNDPYVKAIRWASDRVGDEGIVAFVTNNSFVNEITFDGMRKRLQQDFHSIYILDLGGNVRKNPKLSGSKNNVFGIQVGVSINIFIRRKDTNQPKQAKIYYSRTDEFWRKEQKYDFLNEKGCLDNIEWLEISPDLKHNWLTTALDDSFDSFIALGTKEAKFSKEADVETIFKTYTCGVNTARDSIAYDFNKKSLLERVQQFSDSYNLEVNHYIYKGMPKDVDGFVDYDVIKWSRNLKRHLKNCNNVSLNSNNIRKSLYRPFTTLWLYYADIIVDELGANQKFFPNIEAEDENVAICANQTAEKPFCCIAVRCIPNFVLCGGFGAATQCFPFYTYTEDGRNRQENITDWALEQFKTQYKNNNISKWDIFHYTYAMLNHPQYRHKYEHNLKRNLPHIPFATDFAEFTEAGEKLINLHTKYENQAEYALERIENGDVPLNWRVVKMKLSKDKTKIIYNDFLTLSNIPPEAFEYRLGNRSALEWIIDQYQVKTDKRSGIVKDPNQIDDEEYIVRLIGKMITMSVDTVKIINSLPELF